MPEGPEVEIVKRDLQKLLNKTVSRAFLTDLALNYQRYVDQAGKIQRLEGKTLEKIERHGKFIIFWFNGIPVANHLGMTGGWIVEQASSNKKSNPLSKYAKVVLEFNDNSRTIFDDIRNFGRFQIYNSWEQLITNIKSIKTLGIDGLHIPFDQKEFEKLLSLKRNQNKEIGSLLLDQRVVSGIGNIYKSESLFKAKIHPQRLVMSLSVEEIERLGQSISEILNYALDYGGSSIRNFQAPFGGEGKAQEWHQVYNRAEKTCYNCQTVIVRLVQKTRSTFFCPLCQKK